MRQNGPVLHTFPTLSFSSLTWPFQILFFFLSSSLYRRENWNTEKLIKQVYVLRIQLSCYSGCLGSKALDSASITPHKTSCGGAHAWLQHLGGGSRKIKVQGHPLLPETVSQNRTKNPKGFWQAGLRFSLPKNAYIFYITQEVFWLLNFWLFLFFGILKSF